MGREGEIRILFKPSGQEVYVLPGTLLIEAAERAGIVINNPCDGRGTCGKCKVKVLSGRTEAESQPTLSDSEIAAGYRLACQTEIVDELVVEIPAQTTRGTNEKILTKRNGRSETSLRPGIQKRFFTLTPPSRESSESDADRLSRMLADCHIPYYLLKGIPAKLRASDWSGTAVLRDNELIAIENGDSVKDLYGVAFDIGTTTIVGTLFSLNSGDELAVEAELNPQVKYGADVISRIERVRSDKNILCELHDLAIGALNRIMKKMSERVGIGTEGVYQISIAGNSTMQELLMGIDPSPLGELPFVQAFSSHQTVLAEELKLAANPKARVIIAPQIGGFVGGDTVAAMATAEIDQYRKPVLLIDIGTNGEIVLFAKGRMLAASAAAGPALEGARIEHGMRAAGGAIEKVVFSGNELHINVIGNTPPVGICGTALIDIIALLLNTGILTNDGRLFPVDDLPEDLPADLRERVVDLASGRAFIVAREEESGLDGPVFISQKDISEAQLAVGAIRAGIALLLRQCGLQASDLDEVLLAGAFGNYIRKDNARRIGLIPSVELDRVRFIGNAALHGATRLLLNKDDIAYFDLIADRTSHIDLSMNTDFQNQFAEAMFFPPDNLLTS